MCFRHRRTIGSRSRSVAKTQRSAQSQALDGERRLSAALAPGEGQATGRAHLGTAPPRSAASGRVPRAAAAAAPAGPPPWPTPRRAHRRSRQSAHPPVRPSASGTAPPRRAAHLGCLQVHVGLSRLALSVLQLLEQEGLRLPQQPRPAAPRCTRAGSICQ